MVKDSSKFYPKSLPLVAYILEMVNEGLTSACIARVLGMDKPHVSYYISGAEEQGLICHVFRSASKSYKLTEAGKKFLDQYQKYLSGNTLSVSICRAENIRFIADVLSKPSNLVDWNHVQMKNWNLYTSKIDKVKVKLNLGKRPTIEFLPSPVDGDGALEILVVLVQECQKATFRLEERTGLVVGPLRLEPRGEWVVYSPTARWFSSTYGQVSVHGIGKVNASKPRGIGEFEFQDPRDLVDHMLVPRRVERIETILEMLVRNKESVEVRSSVLQLSLYDVTFFSAYGSLVPVSVL